MRYETNKSNWSPSSKDDILLTFSNRGYIRRLPANKYSCPHRCGIRIFKCKDATRDCVDTLIVTSADSVFVSFTNFGRMFTIHGDSIPEINHDEEAMPIEKLLQLHNGEKVNIFLPVNSFDEYNYLIMVTQRGLAQRTRFSRHVCENKNGIIAMNIEAKDDLISVELTNGNQDIILITKLGMAIRFNEEDIRCTMQNTMGVHGIKLKDADEVIGMVSITSESDLFVITEKGIGKRTEISEYPLQARNGKGSATYRIAERTGPLVEADLINDTKDVLIIVDSNKFTRREAIDIPVMALFTQGIHLNNSRKSKVVGICIINKDD